MYKAALLFSVSSLLSLTACVNDLEEIAQFEQSINPEIELGQGVRIIYSDSAKLRVIIEAPTMHNFVAPGQPKQEFPDGVLVTFFDELQDTSSILSAQWGRYDRKENRVTVRDSVVWQSVDDRMLETEELIWDQRDAMVTTNKFVVVTQPDAIIHGYGLEAPQDFSSARIKQVTGRVPINQPEQ
ncbi:MAG: LPS export ABC transporter periplasmic protein LptC [Bacteroidota bacterium]